MMPSTTVRWSPQGRPRPTQLSFVRWGQVGFDASPLLVAQHELAVFWVGHGRQFGGADVNDLADTP